MIYLTDASIAENIAFGVPKDLIDIDRVKIAAEKAMAAKAAAEKAPLPAQHEAHYKRFSI